MLECMKVSQSVADVCQCDKSSFKELFTNFSFAPNDIAGNFKRSQKGHSDFYPRLQYSYKEFTSVL